MALALVWSSKTLSTILERQFAEKSRTQSEQIQLLLSEKQETATGLVHWIAEMPGVRDALKKQDRARLFQHLLPIVGSIQLDFIEILAKDGTIVLRVHDPTRYGDTPGLSTAVQNLLRGVGDFSNYGIEERDGKAYLRAAESINGEEVLGVVSAGYALDHNLIRQLEQIAGGEVLVTIGSRVYSAARHPNQPSEATVGDRFGFTHRGFGRTLSSPPLQIDLPLHTDRGVEGTISVYFPSEQMEATIAALQKTLIVIAAVGIALALAASWFLSQRFTRPLKELVSGTRQVALGNYEGAVSTRSKDEIGALADSFNRMLEELRRSKAELENYRGELEKTVAERSEQLVETEKKRAAMAHMIAHDLKNPLLGIKKTLERIEQRPGEINSLLEKKVLTDLLSAGDLVIGLVNEMLDIYRSDFGEIPLSQTSFHVEEIVQASVRILGPDIGEKGIHLRIHSNPVHISIIADKRRLTRLLINLLSNAIKFSPSGGSVTISATTQQQNGSGWLELRVEDEGQGMLERDLPKLFDRFYSQDKEKAEAGTGLGLPYCKLVAEAHGGSIKATNGNHRGFTVLVRLPMHEWKRDRVLCRLDC